MLVLIQTNLSGKDIEILQHEVHNLKEENSILKAELNKFKEEAELNEPFFRNYGKKVLYYTGLTT